MSRPPRIPTLTARLALPLLVELRRGGHDAASVLGRVGLEEAQLNSLDGRLSIDAWSDLCAACVAVSGDSGFPLKAATRIERSAFPLEFYLVCSQLTVREGMVFAEYFLATLWGFVRAIAPPSPPPASVSVRHRWPRHGKGLDDVFGAPVDFGRPLR